jgi:hypothetical protein
MSVLVEEGKHSVLTKININITIDNRFGLIFVQFFYQQILVSRMIAGGSILLKDATLYATMV